MRLTREALPPTSGPEKASTIPSLWIYTGNWWATKEVHHLKLTIHSSIRPLRRLPRKRRRASESRLQTETARTAAGYQKRPKSTSRRRSMRKCRRTRKHRRHWFGSVTSTLYNTQKTQSMYPHAMQCMIGAVTRRPSYWSGQSRVPRVVADSAQASIRSALSVRQSSVSARLTMKITWKVAGIPSSPFFAYISARHQSLIEDPKANPHLCRWLQPLKGRRGRCALDAH